MPSDASGPPQGGSNAQQRADRIRAFREELVDLEKLGILQLTEEQRARLTSYHERTLSALAGQFDIDRSAAEKRLSWGMRITSFLGALALCAAVFLFFHRIWGLLGTPTQVAILCAGPLLAILATEFAARRERTLYFASLSALVALACFILNLQALGLIFNVRPTQSALLAWAAFSLLIAYTYGLRILLAGGILFSMGYLSANVAILSGASWFAFGERPENFIVAGIVFFAVPLLAPHRRFDDFPPTYRLIGLLGVFLPMLVLASWGRPSYLFLPDDTIETLYQVLGLLLAGLCIWLGLQRRWGGVTNAGSTFFVIFLYVCFFDWWWEWMPKYLFFLILGLVAIGLLVVLKRIRSLSRGAGS